MQRPEGIQMPDEQGALRQGISRELDISVRIRQCCRSSKLNFNVAAVKQFEIDVKLRFHQTNVGLLVLLLLVSENVLRSS